MATKPANAEQRQWMSDIAEWAAEYIDTLYDGGYAQECNFQLHHVLGRSAKNDKVAIGHWFIIPVPFILHDVSSNNEYNVTHRKKAFTQRFGMQRDLFFEMLEDMRDEGYDLPPADVCEAIRKTNA